MQSGNATALLATSFVARGLMALAPALAIMLGADIGTALMARVLTLDLSWLSPLLIFFGVIFFLGRKQTRLGQLGRVFIGLGLIILALQLIVAAAEPMTQTKGVKVLFSSLTGDIMLDALTGALFAMISYSSLAAVLLTATLAASKVISLKVALCLVVGANLGSGILAMLSATAQNAAGRRVALGSLLFKVAGCLLVLPLVGPLADWMDHWQFSTAELVIAFHVLYNAARCLACLPLTNAMASFCTRVMPDRALPDDVARPRHLDPAALDTPSLALANAVRETLRMGDTVEQMLNNLMQIIRGGDPLLGKDIRKLDDDVDALYTAIKLYLARMPREDLSERDSRRWAEIIELAINLEQAGDIIEHMLAAVQDKDLAQPLVLRHRPGRDRHPVPAVGLQPAPGSLGVPQRRPRQRQAPAPGQTALPSAGTALRPCPCRPPAPAGGTEHRDQLAAPGPDQRHEASQLAVLRHRLRRAGQSRRAEQRGRRGHSAGRGRLGRRSRRR